VGKYGLGRQVAAQRPAAMSLSEAVGSLSQLEARVRVHLTVSPSVEAFL
jgi:hypothetical protein